MLIDFITRYQATLRIFHLFHLPDIVDLELGVLRIMVKDVYL